MPRERGEKVVATNRRARHEYAIEKTYEAGLVLTGTEVKSLREGRANLNDWYAYIDGGQAFLDAVHIPEYGQGTWTNHPPRRKRKLLLHRADRAAVDLHHHLAAGIGNGALEHRLRGRRHRDRQLVGVAQGSRCAAGGLGGQR